MGFGDDVSNRDLTWFVFGIVAGLVLTDSLGAGYALGLEILVVAVIQIRRFDLYEKAVDKYSEPLREKQEALGEKFWSFLDWLVEATDGYGKYIIGGYFISLIGFLLLAPGVPYRWLHIGLVLLAAVEWYFFNLRHLRNFYWKTIANPWMLVAVAALIAAYLFATDQAQPLLKAYIDLLQRGVSQ